MNGCSATLLLFMEKAIQKIYTLTDYGWLVIEFERRLMIDKRQIIIKRMNGIENINYKKLP